MTANTLEKMQNIHLYSELWVVSDADGQHHHSLSYKRLSIHTVNQGLLLTDCYDDYSYNYN